MSSISDDALRIPIEIKTDDVKEINDLINKISEAEDGLQKLKPLKGRTADDSSRSPFVREQPFDSRGGIFSNEMEGAALPQQLRDKTSRAPYQKANEFKEMQKEMQTMQEDQSNIVQNLVNMGFVSQVGGIGGKVQSVMQSGQAPLKNFTKAGGAGVMGLGGGVRGLVGKAGVYGMIALVVYEMVSEVVNMFLAPGGPWDRRFKRDIKNETVKLLDLTQKEDISQGRRVIRVTTNSGLRGTGQVASSLDSYKRGIRVFDLDGHMMSKNIGVGEV